MTHGLKLPLFLAIALLVSLLGWNSYAKVESSSRKAWEYKVVAGAFPADEAQRVLSEYGAEGWELVGIDVTSNVRSHPIYYLKREK